MSEPRTETGTETGTKTGTETGTDRVAVGVPRGAELTRLIADLVVTLPGVVRLEPTIRSALGLRRLVGAPDGVTVSARSGLTDVRVEIATRAAIPARQTAELVEERITALLHERGVAVGSVNVSVLAVERS